VDTVDESADSIDKRQVFTAEDLLLFKLDSLLPNKLISIRSN